MRRIYVIDPAGTIISCYPPEEKAELVGSLIHALSLFSREILRMEISEVRIGHYCMLIGSTKHGLRVAVLSPVEEKSLLERAINELNIAFESIQITPGLITGEIVDTATSAIKRAFEEELPLDMISKIINYASEMPRKAPPKWIEECKEDQRKATKYFEEKIRRALKKKKVSEPYVRATISRLLKRDFKHAWNVALRSGSKIAILHTSIIVSHTDPRIDGFFLRDYFDLVADESAREYLRLYHRAYIDLDSQYNKTIERIGELEESMLGRAEESDEYLILYLPPSITRPKRLEELLPMEEKLLHDFYMKFIRLRQEAETHKEDLEAWRKFAAWSRELYMDLAEKLTYKSPTFFLLISNTLEGVFALAESSTKPELIARSFLEQTIHFIDEAVRSLRHNAWKRISDHTIIAFYTSVLGLAVLSGDRAILEEVLEITNRARSIILETIAYVLLRRRINVFALGYLSELLAISPLIGDEELISILFFNHPMIPHSELENLAKNRPAYGLMISALLHIATLMYEKYCLRREIEHPAIELATVCIQEVERRAGEEETRMMKWLLEKIKRNDNSQR